MTISIEQRFIALERDINRLLDKLTEAATTTDAEEYRNSYEVEMKDLVIRANRLEEAVKALTEKHKIVLREKISE